MNKDKKIERLTDRKRKKEEEESKLKIEHEMP